MNKRNLETKKAILEKIRQYDTIVLARHIRPDGDAIGSTHGLAESLRRSFPNKKVIVSNADFSDYLAFLKTSEEDPETIDYSSVLAIVLDTAGLDRCSNKLITKAKELIKIDHHIDIAPYGDISWVEDDRSSVCEMVTDFLFTFQDELVCDSRVATLLYTGMVTDSGRFRYIETTGETLRLAGFLLDKGIETQKLFANLYLEDFDYYKFQSYVFDKMNITENGVAYLYVDNAMQQQFGLSREQASSSVDFMSGIKGSLIWLAFIDNPDGTIRVRVRSRFLAINTLAEKYHGGGHANASGATAYSIDEMKALIADADAMLKDYKANNEGWI
ncbi:MAG: bifunctional oligoribonuclease/PAP phosphatase NrnA [Sphaerochaetaceae bacterium]|nr:bifunctional oligoribonuclease/PAP phosphatase NrnA [Sphaerochaetaceae bacterium]